MNDGGGTWALSREMCIAILLPLIITIVELALVSQKLFGTAICMLISSAIASPLIICHRAAWRFATKNKAARVMICLFAFVVSWLMLAAVSWDLCFKELIAVKSYQTCAVNGSFFCAYAQEAVLLVRAGCDRGAAICGAGFGFSFSAFNILILTVVSAYPIHIIGSETAKRCCVQRVKSIYGKANNAKDPQSELTSTKLIVMNLIAIGALVFFANFVLGVMDCETFPLFRRGRYSRMVYTSGEQFERVGFYAMLLAVAMVAYQANMSKLYLWRIRRRLERWETKKSRRRD